MINGARKVVGVLGPMPKRSFRGALEAWVISTAARNVQRRSWRMPSISTRVFTQTILRSFGEEQVDERILIADTRCYFPLEG